MYEKKVMKRENWWKKQLRKFFHENQEKKINNVNEWNDVLNQKCLKLDSIKSYSKVCIVSSGFQYIYIFLLMFPSCYLFKLRTPGVDPIDHRPTSVNIWIARPQWDLPLNTV